jgi:2-amino-4-hydroxy-6-hydroxymethyldihydropteridine diphosphokinase
VSERAFIAVGSNLEAERNVTAALELLGRRVRIIATSSFHWTKALGAPAPDFLNGVVEIETELGPLELKRLVLQPIEDELGRERSDDRFAARTIDLDLVLYGDLTSDAEGLVLPAPEIFERAFVALPLLELEPELALPGASSTLAELVQGLSSSGMAPAESFNARLHREERSGRNGQ